MEKKPSNKKSNFFKKEGFYVVLFLCLCIVAAIAAISVKSNSHVKKEPIENKVVENKKEKDSAKAIEGNSKSYNNALEVKKKKTKKMKKRKIKKMKRANKMKRKQLKFQKLKVTVL
ncbi:hypothetical protein JQ032_07000 [Clostridium botulinum]|nr:hypothetical protein [Clostridium botulinum]MCS4475516.1 hypothetical protein [Clostridium botulinum]